jgi:hypothetical protein
VLIGRAREIERERGRADEGNRRQQTSLTGQREGERAWARTRAVADRWDPPVRRRGRARDLAGLSWAEWVHFDFLFPWNF